MVFIFSVICHEVAHGLAAVKLGDPTAHKLGLVTLDPVPHIKRSPFGMVIVPLISFFMNGWMIGWASVPYNINWARNNRKKTVYMSIAGPAANLSLVIIAAIIIRLGMTLGYFHPPEQTNFTRITEAYNHGMINSVAILVSVLFSLNLILFTFNLIPLPPLDGTAILTFFMNDETADKYKAFLSQPGASIIGLIIAWQVFGWLFGPIHTLALNILYPGQGYHPI